MSTAELKEKLIEEINKIDNELFLKDVLGMFRDQNRGKYVLSSDEIQMINESLEQYERGEFYTDEEVRKETDQWLAE